MEARIFRTFALAAAIAAMGASHRSSNFVVSGPTPEIAREVCDAAEKYRQQLAIEWLGRELPDWAQPCPITLQVGETLGAGGATSFLFERGEVFGWQMTIQGSRERILDSVLPHEVTHTIFATHFRQPLPRWADEGACTTVEHVSEKAKQQSMLIDFLRTNRGIPFSQMFVMREYPRDVMPLYSQGYSLARYLIQQGGRKKFLNFLSDGLRDQNWTRATNAAYGYDNLAVLQNSWLGWVRQGSPALRGTPETPGRTAPLLAANDRRSRPAPNLIYRAASNVADNGGASSYTENFADNRAASGASNATASKDAADEIAARAAGGLKWRPKSATASKSTGGQAPAGPSSGPNDSAHQVTRPQPIEQSRQIILEWSKPEPGGPPLVEATGGERKILR